MKYKTDLSFKCAIEDKLGEEVPRVIWNFCLDCLHREGLHEAYDDEDVQDSMPMVKRALEIYKRNGK